jgi:hypothetical protein
VRNFSIEVHVRPNGGSHSASMKESDGKYHVYIDESELKKYGVEAVAVTAHEIGHALGFEFDLPKHREMQHAEFSFHPPTAEDIAVLDHNREVEAWSVARAMFKTEAIGLGLHHLSHQAQIQHEETMNKFNAFMKTL